MIEVIETFTEYIHRLQWAQTDLHTLAAMFADPQAMAYFPGTLNRRESHAVAEKFQAQNTERRWGVWAAKDF